uniref:Secreted protein n=1 Tax=Mus musculus TaxID=10090 RepID=Q3U0R4_MOUSE|nr:unnamed protein product [Mus musculus]
MQLLPLALPWLHFCLQWLCVWRSGSPLPVEIPALSTVLELLESSSVHYQPSLLEQRKTTVKIPEWGVLASASGRAGTPAACLTLLCPLIRCTKFDDAARPPAAERSN